ncbi:MAG: coproporphyrinogen III oxidase, partial [Bacteroidota bacterium]
SDAWNAFAKNEKEVEAYEEKISKGFLPLVHGHLLNQEDVVIRKKILELMCENRTILEHQILDAAFINSAFLKLTELEADGLVIVKEKSIKVTPKGMLFIRNISAAIDLQLWRKQMNANTFSRAI